MRSSLVVGALVGSFVACGGDPPPTVEHADDDRVLDAPEAEAPAAKCPRVPLSSRMTTTIADACREIAVAPTTRDPEIDRTVRGHWTGQYDGDSTDPVAFEASFTVLDGVLTGTTTEPNTFAHVYGYSELEADVSGDVFGSGQVVWMKTYRTGGVSHSVLYLGTLNEAGKRLEGHWRLGGTKGTFSMTHD